MNAAEQQPHNSSTRRVAVVTGTRAEFGLLCPVMHAIDDHPELELRTIVTGTHLLMPAHTLDEVAAEFNTHAIVPMQREGEATRAQDAHALGRGIIGLAGAYEEIDPDIVLVLGDRIEAFAAACAASVSGIRVAHLHGGDRAEGVADESLRHATTKLAHIHLPATASSADRIVSMGELPQTVHLVGSPAVDGLDDIPPLDDTRYRQLGTPKVTFLLHPIGRPDEDEYDVAARLVEVASRYGNVLALHPNFDPGREGILRAINASGVRVRDHLPRREFVGLLRRTSVLLGNSSAGLIEAAVLGTWCINIGTRQGGRERPGNVLDVPDEDASAVDALLQQYCHADRWSGKHPYGTGQAGRRTADVLAGLDFGVHPLRKQNSY